jgi:hypothetical protein
VSEDATIAAQRRMLEDWSDESLYWNLMVFRWSTENEHRTIAQNSQFVPAPVRPFAKPLLRRLVGRQSKAQGPGRFPYDILIAGFGERLDDLAMLLGKQAFFCSDRTQRGRFRDLRCTRDRLCGGSHARLRGRGLPTPGAGRLAVARKKKLRF